MTRFRAPQQLVRARFEIGVTLGFSLTTSALHGLENSTIVHLKRIIQASQLILIVPSIIVRK